MKIVTMSRDFDYRPRAGVIIAYVSGRTYPRVPEAAVAAIKKAKAGTIHGDKIARKAAAAGKDGGATGGSPVGDQAGAG
ncbi:hypothetical protein [Tardiphaga sp.]|uniref:hypothetical protein n=1 Tax=Tardiphaga sp. TaxID=1926292 RepID=UPI0037DA154B